MPLLDVDDASKARSLLQKFREKERATQRTPPQPGPITRAVSQPSGDQRRALGEIGATQRQVDAFQSLSQQEAQQRAPRTGISAGDFLGRAAGALDAPILDQFVDEGSGPLYNLAREATRPTTALAALIPGGAAFRGAGYGTRLLGETVGGALARGAASETAERTQNAPTPIRVGAPIVAGLAAGIGGVGAVGGLRSGARRGASAAGRQLDDAALRAAAGPAERSSLGVLRSVDDAAGAVEPAAAVRARNVEQFGQPGRPRVAGSAEAPARVLDDLLVPGQDPGIGSLKRYEGAVNTAGLEIRRDLDAGNRLLAQTGIGKPTGASRIVPRDPDVESLYLALHGEGPVPPRLQGAFDTLKAQVDAETAATVDFDPKFMAHPDYFPRGWRVVETSPARAGNTGATGAGAVGSTPGFAKPRVDSSFAEILSSTYTRSDGSTYRLEPTSWNPFEQMALRRVAGVEFREQKVLVDRLKQTGAAVVVDGPLPEGYRVPRVGPAFEGKPQIAPGVDDAPPSFYGYTDRYAVPDKVANVLENLYGKRVTLGKGPDAILSVLQGAKRVKLLGSLFQQVDFTTRTGFASFGGALDDLIAGKPLTAVKKVATLPVEIGRLLRANFSASARANLRDEILSNKPIFPDRPGITLRGVAEGGWSQADISIVRRDIKRAFTDAVGDEALTAAARRNLMRIEAANQRGLFDGVYPQAQVSALKNWILPRLMRQHPDWTDAQITAQAADEVNKAFSTLGDYQTILKNPYVQHLAHNLIFSTNEPEALVRGFGSQFKGPNKQLWAEFYAGGFLFLGAVANLVHMATTALRGDMETLPVERYNPVKLDEFSPLGVSYNTRFLTPDTPIPGEGGKRVMADLLAQMDTALQLLNPVAFLTNRLNVGPRAIQNQLQGEDFFGNRIDEVGPKGIVSRGAQAVADLYEPIGAGNIRTQIINPPVRGEPIGRGGGIAQAAGVNVRAETSAEVAKREGFSSLSGEQQLTAVRSEAWRETRAVFGEHMAQGKTYGEWLSGRIQSVAADLRAIGQSESQAVFNAEKAVAKEPIAKFYTDKRNRLEDRWGLDNPQAAAEVLDRESKLRPGERTFRPTEGVRTYIESQRGTRPIPQNNSSVNAR